MGGALGLFGEVDQKRLLIIGLGFCPGEELWERDGVMGIERADPL